MDNLMVEDIQFLAAAFGLGVFAVYSISWFLDKSPVSDWFKASEGIAVSFITVPAFLFGLGMSSLTTNIINNKDTAKISLINEVSAIRTLVNIASTLPAQDQVKLNSGINDYVVAVINKEWANMMSKDPSINGLAFPEFESLSSTVNQIASTPHQNSFVANRLESSIDSIRHERLVRLNLAQEKINLLKWPSFFSLSFLMLFSIGLLQLRAPRAMRIALTMGALCIGTTVLFIFLNSSPYGGNQPVKPNLLEESLKRIDLLPQKH